MGPIGQRNFYDTVEAESECIVLRIAVPHSVLSH
jgi:hypothetical protein